MQQRSLSALFFILTTIACNLPAGVSPPPATATVTRTFFPLDQTATQAALSTLLFLTGTATPPPVTLPPQPSSAFPTLTPNALTTTAQAALVTPSITVTSFFLTIQRFEADRELIAPGESFTVFWETSGDQVSLCSVLQSGESGLCEEVPSSGSRLVSTTATDRNTSAITLISVAGEITETVILSVRLTCPVSWFFSPSPAGENGEALCPREGSQPSGGAYQRFERGLMIWRQATDTIFVLFSDGGSPAYLIVPDPWVDGQAESDPGLVPPEGRS